MLIQQQAHVTDATARAHTAEQKLADMARIAARLAAHDGDINPSSSQARTTATFAEEDHKEGPPFEPLYPRIGTQVARFLCENRIVHEWRVQAGSVRNSGDSHRVEAWRILHIEHDRTSSIGRVTILVYVPNPTTCHRIEGGWRRNVSTINSRIMREVFVEFIMTA